MLSFSQTRYKNRPQSLRTCFAPVVRKFRLQCFNCLNFVSSKIFFLQNHVYKGILQPEQFADCCWSNSCVPIVTRTVLSLRVARASIMPPNFREWFISKRQVVGRLVVVTRYIYLGKSCGTDTGMAFGVLAISSRLSVRLAGGQFCCQFTGISHAVVPNMIGLLIQHVYQFRFFPMVTTPALSRGMKYISPDFHSLPSLSRFSNSPETECPRIQ